MRTFLMRALWGTLLAGGITLLGATAANAEETTGDDGLLSGTQALLNVDIPVNVTGLALSILGDATSTGATTAPAPAPAPAQPATTSGADGIASGTQALINVAVPVTVTGNAVSVVGDATSTDASAPATAAPAVVAPAASTSGADSILGGTQVIAPASVPITVTGNAISVIGDSTATGATATPAAATGGTAPAATTSGLDSILGGTQLMAPIALPITVGGNAISVIGDSTTTAPTVPAAPAAPVVPTEPTEAVIPTTPTTIVTPTVTTMAATGSPTTAAALAATGGPGALPAAAMGLVLVAAGAIALARRRHA